MWSYGDGGRARQRARASSSSRTARSGSTSGNVLISDAGDDIYASRVIEVDRATGAIDWQYGVTGPPGAGDGLPAASRTIAARLPDGDTLIADTATYACSESADDGQGIVRSYDMSTLATPPGYEHRGRPSPRQAAYTRDGLLVGRRQRSSSRSCCSATKARRRRPPLPLDCGHPGVGQGVREPHVEGRHRRSRDEGRRWSTGSDNGLVAAVHVHERASRVRLQGRDRTARRSPTG